MKLDAGAARRQLGLFAISAPGIPGWKESIATACGLGFIAVLVFGPYVAHGGFIADDWFLSSVHRYGLTPDLRPGLPPGGFLHDVGRFLTVYRDRPVAAPFYAAIYTVFGSHLALYLATSIALAVAVAGAFFAFLRSLGLERSHATLLAVLALLFPFADTSHLWSAGDQSDLAVLLFLIGALLALHGLRRCGRRAVLWHAAAVLAYLLSVLDYQLTLGLVAFMVMPYAVIATRRAALARSAIDLSLVVPTVLVAAASSPKVTAAIDIPRVAHVYEKAMSVLSVAAVPVGTWPGSWNRPVAGVIVLAILAASALVFFVTKRRREDRSDLRRWLIIAILSTGWVAASYVAILPAPAYVPYPMGIGNRINVAASLGFVTLVYSTVMLFGLSVMAKRAAAIAVIAALLLAAGYVHVERQHTETWTRAFAEGQQVLAAVEQARRNLPPGATVYTTGHYTYTGEVPVFFNGYDLNSAVKVSTRDPSLRGYPLPGATALTCDAHTVAAVPWPTSQTAYDRAYVVAVPSRRVIPIRSQQNCLLVALSLRKAGSYWLGGQR